MSYYEFGVHPIPVGSDSASRVALAAKRMGFNGIIVSARENPDHIFRFDAASNIKGIDIVKGAEIWAKNGKALKGLIASLRMKVPFLMVLGGPDSINRVACEDPKTDVLMAPKDSRLSIAAARAARTNQVAIGFDLSPLIRTRGASRARWIENFKSNLTLSRKFDLKMVITLSPKSHLDFRGPREMMALAMQIGMRQDEVKDALSFPGELVRLNTKDWVGPGVELL